MDLSIIKEFMYLSKDLSFSKTAKRCHVSQSVFSRHISSLEAELGFQLLERSNKSVRLTPYGEAFAKRAKEIVSSYESAMIELRNLSDGFSQTLSISYMNSLSRSFLHQAYALHLSRNPTVKLELMSSWEERVITLLSQGRTDIALIPIFEKPDLSIYSYTVLYDDYFVLLVPEGHRLYDHDSVMFKDLVGEAVLIPTDRESPMQNKRLNRTFDKHQNIKIKSLIANKLDGVALTNGGYGLAVMPSHQIGNLELHGCKALRLIGNEFDFSVCAVWHAKDDSEKTQRFISTLKEVVSQMSPDALRNTSA